MRCASEVGDGGASAVSAALALDRSRKSEDGRVNRRQKTDRPLSPPAPFARTGALGRDVCVIDCHENARKQLVWLALLVRMMLKTDCVADERLNFTFVRPPQHCRRLQS